MSLKIFYVQQIELKSLSLLQTIVEQLDERCDRIYVSIFFFPILWTWIDEVVSKDHLILKPERNFRIPNRRWIQSTIGILNSKKKNLLMHPKYRQQCCLQWVYNEEYNIASRGRTIPKVQTCSVIWPHLNFDIEYWFFMKSKKLEFFLSKIDYFPRYNFTIYFIPTNIFF